MRIAVTGRTGEVARCLAEIARDRPDLQLVFLSRPLFDLLDPAGMRVALSEAAPDVVIAAAAFTDVEASEADPVTAYRVNAEGAETLARATRAVGAALIQLSTDYVFAGDKIGAYEETDEPGPINAYGASKLAGERLVAAACPRSVIVRTASVTSPFGRRFASAILKQAATGDDIAVVADQWSNPTPGLDLAKGLLLLADAMRSGDAPARLYHLAGAGAASRSEMAREVLRQSRERGGPFAEVREIATASLSARARRPLNSRLASDRFGSDFGWRPADWRTAIGPMLDGMLAERTPETVR